MPSWPPPRRPRSRRERPARAAAHGHNRAAGGLFPVAAGTREMVDLNDVALFVQVVRAGTFSEAARRLGMPPNTASRRIQHLEQQLGLRLLHRSTRRLTLTDAGEAFHARCAEQVE